MPAPTYSPTTRLLHALIAATVTIQLVSSLVMDHPRTARPMTQAGGWLFRAHEWIGLAALGVLVVSWAYRVLSWKRQSQGRLFPWITRQGLFALVQEALAFLRLKWTRIPEDGALVGMVHGAGLVVASLMALTGGALYVLLGPADTVTPTVRAVMEVHSTIATLMWIYFYGHAAMALWHQYMGHGTLARMFRFGASTDRPPRGRR